MSSATIKAAPVDGTATPCRAAQTTPARLLAENAKLVDRVRDLQVALEAAGRDTGELRGELSRARAEIRRVRSEQQAAEAAPALAELERGPRVRLMLRDTHSRNP